MKTVDPTLLNDADFAEQVTLERAEKPASRWRNKWRTLEYVTCDCGSASYAGDEYFEGECCDPVVHPSKDVAETYARKEQAEDVAEWGYQFDVYLGAHPVEGDA